MRSVQKVYSHVIWKIETFIEEDTRYKKHCTYDNDISVSFKLESWTSTALPVAISCPIVFSWISSAVWNLFPFKGVLVLEKARCHRATNLGYRGDKSPGWFDVSPQKKLCTRHDAWASVFSWSSCQSPVAHMHIAVAFWIIQIVSVEKRSSLMQNWMQKTHCSTHLVILSATATQYTCSLNGIYCPHWLVQWSHHWSHTCIQVHSSHCQVTSMLCKPFSLY